jgi:FkbM family methyltransferase
MPDPNDSKMAVLAVEANIQLYNNMPRHPRLFVMYCAIGAHAGFAQFNSYNTNGLSSSLSKPANQTANFVKTNLAERSSIVPVLTLLALLEAIPSNIHIEFLKTDLQGHDYAALLSAGSMLRRVSRIMSECYAPGTSTYANAHNECDRDIDPLLSRLGFYRIEITASYVNEFDVVYETRSGAESKVPHFLHQNVDNQAFGPVIRNALAPVWLPVVRTPVLRDAYSQCGQDYIVRHLFPEKVESNAFFYIDLASNDAIDISNTYLLDIHGWSGLCIEANPQYWYGLTSQRNCTVVGAAVAEKDHQILPFVFDGVFGGLLGGEFDNKQGDSKVVTNVPTMSLATIFERFNVPQTIHYLSLDVEGAEWFIMQHFPFHNYSFHVLTIERPGAKLSDLLRAKGYVFIGKTSNFDDELWFSRDFFSRRFQSIMPTVEMLREGYSGPRC